ncbi:MAG: hypothetical protein R6X27_04540 [Candidatus Desulfacyla sp.]
MRFRWVPMLFLSLWVFALPSAHVAATVTDNGASAAKIQELETLLQSINNTRRIISATQDLLKRPEAVGRESELQAGLADLSQKLNEMEISFERLSTGVDPQTFTEGKKEEMSWHQELTELIRPLVREVKKMTSRPRELEKLRVDRQVHEDRRQVAEKARIRLLALMTQSGNPQLTEYLNRMVRIWDQKEQASATKIAIINQQIDEILEGQKSFMQSLKDLTRVFFTGRGKNIFLAILAFALVWIGLHYLHKPISKLSPFHKKGRTFLARAFDLVYVLFKVFVSFFIFLGVLYCMGDWVMLSLAVIFALGVAWAFKQSLPRVWNEAALMLNFGTVREGEVVVYNGILYEVLSINMHTHLRNRNLDGGSVRLHIKDLVDFRSRPAFEDEVWFPSKRGDWVILEDTAYGEVVAQTPEMVQIRMLGGATKSYSTQAYLSQSPTNLSQGFRIRAAFGLDYQHQAIITKDVPAAIEKALLDGLATQGYGDGIERIRVEFSNAGASSLDLAVLAEFKGTEGRRYMVLQRAIQRICVETCSEKGWIIPFQQVTVHMPEGHASS